MAIKTRSHAEIEHFDVGFAGTQSTGPKQVIMIPFPCILKNLYARLRTAGTTGSQTVDIQKNGVSIFASGFIAFATTVTVPTYGPLTTNPTSFVKGDIITINITAVHTTPGVDLGLALVLQRPRASGVVAATVLDGIGIENE